MGPRQSGKAVLPGTRRAGEIRSRCSGRKADTTATVMTFVELVPEHPKLESLVLATTLPVAGRFDVQGIAHVYAQGWSIESAFETMRA